MENQRRQVIIKNQFQHKLILSTVLITLIMLNVIIISAFLLEYFVAERAGVINVFVSSVAIMEVIAVFIVYRISRRISFRIAGPVYAIERTLRDMKEGDITQRLQLRSGDHFAEVAEAINGVLETYQDRISRLQATLSEHQESGAEQRRNLEEQLAWFITERDQKAS